MGVRSPLLATRGSKVGVRSQRGFLTYTTIPYIDEPSQGPASTDKIIDTKLYSIIHKFCIFFDKIL